MAPVRWRHGRGPLCYTKNVDTHSQSGIRVHPKICVYPRGQLLLILAVALSFGAAKLRGFEAEASSCFSPFTMRADDRSPARTHSREEPYARHSGSRRRGI